MVYYLCLVCFGVFNTKGVITMKLSKSDLRIVTHIEIDGSKTQKQIINELNLPVRTVRYGLRKLLRCDLLYKLPNWTDLRSVLYKRTILSIKEF